MVTHFACHAPEIVRFERGHAIAKICFSGRSCELAAGKKKNRNQAA